MERLKNMLNSFLDSFEITNYDGNDDNYKCKIRCSLSYKGDNDAKSGYFIDKFSEATRTNWIVLRRYSKPICYEFRKIFICHLSERNETENKRNGLTRK